VPLQCCDALNLCMRCAEYCVTVLLLLLLLRRGVGSRSCS
jgi:hypothetical protein